MWKIWILIELNHYKFINTFIHLTINLIAKITVQSDVSEYDPQIH